MANKINRIPMPEQDPKIRATNFDEVTLGYTLEMALTEASRCIECKNPRCVKGCPVNIDIPGFISKIKTGDIKDAFNKLKETNALPAVCGRVCPQEEQCEELCVLAIKGESVAIGRLERYCADYMMDKETSITPVKSNGIKTAIIGAGPAGLACAGELIKLGYEVVVFEAFHEAGGVLMYGIPEFRLPKHIVQTEIQALKDAGVEFELNTVAGRTITIDEMFEEGFKSVFIGSGAGLPKFMKIPGENLNGVYSANEYLTRINLMKAYKADSQTPIRKAAKTVVVGGGNVAMDAARCALRMGSQVTLVYRRSLEEMPARLEEVHHAIDEGIEFMTLNNPIKILGENGNVTGVKCIKMELGEPDDSGRRRPIAIEGSEFIIQTNSVIMSIGTNPNPLIASTTNKLDTYFWGGVIVDEETQSTSVDGVFCGGDAATGAATVIKAMGAGKTASVYMDKYMKENVK